MDCIYDPAKLDHFVIFKKRFSLVGLVRTNPTNTRAPTYSGLKTGLNLFCYFLVLCHLVLKSNVEIAGQASPITWTLWNISRTFTSPKMVPGLLQNLLLSPLRNWSRQRGDWFRSTQQAKGQKVTVPTRQTLFFCRRRHRVLSNLLLELTQTRIKALRTQIKKFWLIIPERILL